MRCAFTNNLLDLYLDGRLVASQARWVEAHLAACPKCAARFAAWRKISRELRTFRTSAAPASFKAGLRAVLLNADSAAAAPEIGVDRDLLPGLIPSLSFAFSALAFLLFVSGSVFGPGIPSQSCANNGDSICAANFDQTKGNK